MFEIWIQGGPFDDTRWVVGEEPPAVLRLMPDPFNAGRIIRVSGPWPDAVEYKRVPSVEQFTHERIYYPAEWSK